MSASLSKPRLVKKTRVRPANSLASPANEARFSGAEAIVKRLVPSPSEFAALIPVLSVQIRLNLILAACSQVARLRSIAPETSLPGLMFGACFNEFETASVIGEPDFQRSGIFPPA